MTATSLTVPVLIHWNGEPPPDLVRFARPIRIPFRIISADRTSFQQTPAQPRDPRNGHTPIT